MTTDQIASGPLHRLPADFKKALDSTPKAKAAWGHTTPLARNEWICWTTIVKQAKTRKEHVARAMEELAEGKRRPCCWPGCPHRHPKAKKWFSKQKG